MDEFVIRTEDIKNIEVCNKTEIRIDLTDGSALFSCDNAEKLAEKINDCISKGVSDFRLSPALF